MIRPPDRWRYLPEPGRLTASHLEAVPTMKRVGWIIVISVLLLGLAGTAPYAVDQADAAGRPDPRRHAERPRRRGPHAAGAGQPARRRPGQPRGPGPRRVRHRAGGRAAAAVQLPGQRAAGDLRADPQRAQAEGRRL